MPMHAGASWQSYAESALGELAESEDTNNADVCDECLQRAAIYAILAVASAIAHDDWGRSEHLDHR